MNECAVPEGRRVVRLIAKDSDGRIIDSIEVSGPNAGTEGQQSGVEMGDGELKEMWHARRTREETALIGIPGATPGADQVEVRRWSMRLVTKQTDHQTWEEVERRLWRLTTPDRIGGRTGFFVIQYVERNGEGREITVKRTGTPEPESKTYAGQRGHESWTFEVTAYDPWWYGEPEVARWEAGAGSSDTVLSLRNRGDQMAHLHFVFPAANGTATWTVPDGVGTYPNGHDKAGQIITHTLPQIPAERHAEAHQRPDKLPFRIIGLPMSFGMMKQARFTHPLEPSLSAYELPVSVETAATDAAVEVRLIPAFDRPHS